MKEGIVLATVKPESNRTSEETLALGYLASMLRRGGYQNVKLIDGWLRNVSNDQLLKIAFEGGRPSIIGLSCYRSNLSRTKDFLDLVKSVDEDVIFMCGGYGPTFHEEDFLNVAGFDVVVIGEAENIIVPLVGALLNAGDLNNVPGIIFKKNNTIIHTEKPSICLDLDSLPFPVRDEIEFTRVAKNPAHICTSRGCMGNCDFCSISAFFRHSERKAKWRGRSVPNILEEIYYLHENFGITHIKFVDDSFLEPPRGEEWVYSLKDGLKKLGINLRFRTQIRADRLTPFIVKNLKECGWFATSVGIENGSETALRRMGKKASLKDNEQALSLLYDEDIYTQMGMILFDPFTSMFELEENYSFLSRHRGVITKGIFTEKYAAKGTIFTEKLFKKGLAVIDSSTQNYRYVVINNDARRVYNMLKMWHRSHSTIYDWVIDSLAAPKVLPDDGYREVYKLCNILFGSDISFFRKALDRVEKGGSQSEDQAFLAEAIKDEDSLYKILEKGINFIYDTYGLTYNAVANPFLA